jgi:hypothetical protein
MRTASKRFGKQKLNKITTLRDDVLYCESTLSELKSNQSSVIIVSIVRAKKLAHEFLKSLNADGVNLMQICYSVYSSDAR